MQKAFLLELERCTGCGACQIACQIENDLAPGTAWRRIYTFNESHVPGVSQFHLSLACNHCLDAPCEKNCPALAYDKDPLTGAVTIDPEHCIGCKYCSWACPYDAPQFRPSAGIMEKCTFCSPRLADGLEPACTTSCPTGALRFGDFESESEPSPIPGFYRRNIEPAIQIRAIRPMRPSNMAGRVDWISAAAPNAKKVTLRSEWSLLVFTLVAPLLVALVASGTVTTPSAIVATAGVAVMGLSAAHLGKPRRAYRAMLNWRRSWLSREILLFPVFVALSCLPGARWPASLVGFAALLAMDQVYRLPTNRKREISSGSVLLTGAYLASLFAGLAWIFLPLAGLKLLLYLRRRFKTARTRPAMFAARIALGFVLPALLAFQSDPLALLSIVAGEVLDRAEFYLDLDFTTPASEMRLALASAVRH